MTQEDTGLAVRGFALLAVMTAIVGVVLFIMFRGSGQPEPQHDLAGVAPSPVGWEIRYNAAAALARRGSKQVPWAVLREMLDERQQLRNFQVVLHDGREVPDEVAARTAVISALKAVGEWHNKQRPRGDGPLPDGIAAVYEQVDRLAQSPVVELRKEAEKTRGTFSRG